MNRKGKRFDLLLNWLEVKREFRCKVKINRVCQKQRFNVLYRFDYVSRVSVLRLPFRICKNKELDRFFNYLLSFLSI